MKNNPIKWRKLGQVFDPEKVTNRNWLRHFAQAPSVVLLDDRIRVYFSCRPEPSATGLYVSYSTYLDLDRQDIFKILDIGEEPILPLGQRGCFDEFGTYPVSVIKHDDKYLAYYGGWTRCESVPFDVAIGMAHSTDGKQFERVGQGPVLAASAKEPFVISGPKIRRFNEKFYLFYIAGCRWIVSDGKPEPVYKIRMAKSDDGVQWSRLGSDLIDNVLGEDEAQASPDVHFRDGKYHMNFCYRHGSDYRNRDRGYRIGYAWSEDLITWSRQDDCAGIDVSESGWDSEMISYPHVFNLNDRWYMFYLGNEVGRNGFGVAEMVDDK